MNTNMKQRTLSGLIFALAAVTLLVSGCKDFSFFSELGTKGELKLSPSEVTLTVDTALTFVAIGGNPPYTYQLTSGSGSIDPVTGAYLAPSSASTDIVMAVDSTDQSGTATVTIVTTLDVLTIMPNSVAVPVGSSLSFIATGGVGPYTYDIQANNSGGSITGGDYTAGFTTGIDTIRVTDSDTPTPNSVTANVTVTAVQNNVDYTTNPGDDTFPPDAFVGSALSGDFTITNIDAGTGSASISWWLFISEDGTFGGDGEYLLASGVVTDDIPGSGTSVVTPSGSWPANLPQGSYQLYVLISSPDDLEHGNNEYDAGTVALNVPDVDYQVVSVIHSDPAPRYGQSFSGQFELANAGTDDSTALADWEIWISEDTIIGAGDLKIDSGTEAVPAMTAGELPYKVVSFSGAWPYGSGNSTDYHILALVSSSQDAAAGNDGADNTGDSGAVTVYPPQVDYDLLSVSHSTGTVAGRTVTGSFQLDNAGPDDGSAADVEYTVYASTDTGVPDAADTVVAFGTTASMTAAELPKTVNFTGTWPVAGDNYYLIVEVKHPDDIDASDDVDWTAASVSVNEPVVDYQAEILAAGILGNIAGNAVSGSFTLTNNGPDDSLEEVEWSVYASTDTTLDVSDWLIDSALDSGAYAASASASIPFSGTWHPLAGSYYLLVKITSAEDVISGTTGNNLAVSLDASGGSPTPLPITAPKVNYRVTSVSFIGGSKGLGGSFTGEFQYANNGSDNGARPLEWAAYASLDQTLDAGDLCVGSGGGLVPLKSGSTSGAVPFSGIWPYDYGDYYLFVEVTSQDSEADPLDDSNYDPSVISVGYYAETPELTSPFTDYNDDWTNLVNVDRFGVTLKPGTSVCITGNMGASDYDDIFEFPLDPLTTTVTVTASWATAIPPSRQVTLWYFIGPGGDDAGFGGYYVAGGTEITVVWEPTTLPGFPFPMVWIDMENSDLNNLGNTKIVITAN